MRIAVIGTGHVGLVVGTGLAETGHYVTCVDTDRALIEGLNANALPFYEPGLEELVARNVEEERLKFTTDVAAAVSDALLVFICVGTPAGHSGEADTSAVFAAVQSVGHAMPGYRIIVRK
ncbi:MAG: UDP-glucose/GDP-mannose dehydrogenase family protein, partial [Candidatus Hydrogenedentes bacterium]|nr:UDP-glucose/GDP-mannose dehydrogenase family protein [Candidatus Hydrogenedentota bacterium]